MSEAPTKIAVAPIAAFCLFDFANSAFTTVVGTFVFATYFTNGVAADRVTGAAQWSIAMAVAGLLIAILSPLFGAIADQTGRRKPWLVVMSVVCVASSAALWYVRPDVSDVTFALVTVVIATIGFEMGMLFYNALLPAIAPQRIMGRVSGWAWGIGYAGGLIALDICLFALVQTDTPPFGLDKATAEPVRATSLLVAIWFAVFAIPLFIFVKEPPPTGISAKDAVTRGVRQLVKSLTDLRGHGNLLRYLIAAMIYTDGIHTIFTLGGVYAAATYGMDVTEVIKLGLALNVTAGLGAFIGGWVDDRIGSKRTIIVSLVALLITSAAVIAAPDKMTFWIAAVIMATFFGPVQAASRTLMAKLSPPEERGEMFGLFALSGKVTAFAGPAVVGWVTLTTGSQRVGLASVLIFLGVGLWMLRGVREDAEITTSP